MLLQTGRFRQFWDEAAKSRHIVEAVPGNNYILLIYDMIFVMINELLMI